MKTETTNILPDYALEGPVAEGYYTLLAKGAVCPSRLCVNREMMGDEETYYVSVNSIRLAAFPSGKLAQSAIARIKKALAHAQI
jgi:hypothetical protein